MTTITSTAPTTITANNWPNIIDGRDTVGGGEEVLRDSPAHDVRVASYHSASEAEVDAAVMAAHKAFSTGDWPRTSGAERAALLRRVAARIEAELDELALIETLESGKPISQAKDEVTSAAGIWYYAASLAQHAYGDAHNDLGPNYLAVTVKEPIGVVGVITPWNFPLLIVSQKLPFALAVGCAAVVKPSDLTPGTTTRLVQILHDEGLPDGVVNLVHGGGDVGGWLSGHPGTHMTTFTGSTGVGRMVAQAAAKHLKKASLEAGRTRRLSSPTRISTLRWRRSFSVRTSIKASAAMPAPGFWCTPTSPMSSPNASWSARRMSQSEIRSTQPPRWER